MQALVKWAAALKNREHERKYAVIPVQLSIFDTDARWNRCLSKLDSGLFHICTLLKRCHQSLDNSRYIHHQPRSCATSVPILYQESRCASRF